MSELFPRLIPFVGIAVMVAICLAMSTNRGAALKRWDLIAWGFGLQFVFALLILKTEPGAWLFSAANDVFIGVIGATQAGSEFVFGPLAKNPSPVSMGPIIAFYVLPTIIFFSALMSVLYHLGVMQKVVRGLAWVMQRTLKTSGAETLSASANIFVGQTEAPLVVRPFIGKMTQSELMTVMVGGFATVAGGVMAAYVSFLQNSIPNIAGHLMAASVMSAPAALIFGKLMVPETETPETAGTLPINVEKETTNVLDAATVGTTEGVRLAINVGGMLIAFLALIALVDICLGGIGKAIFGGTVPTWYSEWVNLRAAVGAVFAPLAWLMGITEWGDAVQVGRLMGIKMVANEFVAYIDLGAIGDAGAISERSRIIATYALCGFANFGSIGIQIGGLAVMAPERRADLSRLALRAMLAGTFAANATGCVAAILI